MNPPETSEERTKTKILGNPEPSAATTRQGQKEHFLKVWPMFFDALLDGSKSFEVRKNDRDFRVGDTLDLHEFVPASGGFTGRAITRQVTYILEGSGTVGTQFGVQAGYVVMGLASSVGQGTEEQPTPPVTKNQSLADILNEIESRANAATPGPWKVSGYRPFGIIQRDPQESTYARGDDKFSQFVNVSGNFETQKNNSAFIASARTDVPRLVKALLEALKVAKTMPAMAYERITDNCLVDALPNDLQCDYDFLEQSLAAILTSPENGEEQRQSLGEH